MTVRELIVKLGIETDQSRLEEFEDQLGRVKETAMALGSALATVAASYGAVGAAASKAAINVLEYSEEVARNSEAMGLATDKYQKFRFAFKNLGASTDDMMDAFSTVTDRAKAATEGVESYQKEFTRLGISIDELKNKKPGEIFEKYMGAAQKAGEQTDKVTAAVRLFGDDLGRRILPALTSSTESFATMMERAEKSGVVVPEEQIEKARKVRFEYRELVGRLNAIWRTIGFRVLPVFTEFMRKFQTFLSERQASEDLFEAVETGIRNWAENIRVVLEFFSDLGDFFSSMVAGEWTDYVELVIQSIKMLGAIIIGALSYAFISSVVGLFQSFGGIIAAIAAKFIAIGALIAGIVLLFEDFYVFMKGGNSLIGEIMDRFGEGTGLLDQIVRTIEDSIPALKTIWGFVELLGSFLIPIIWEAIKATGKIFAAIVKAALKIFLALISSGMKILEGFFQFIRDTIKLLAQLWLGNWGQAAETLHQMFFDLGETIVKAATQAYESIMDTFKHLGMSVLSTLLEGVMNLIGAIPGVGSAATDALEEMNEKLEAEMRTESEVELNAPKSRQGLQQQGRQAAQDSMVMFGRQSLGGATSRVKNEGDSKKVEQEINQNIEVGAEVSKKTKDRIEDSAEKMNRDAAAQFEGGER